jgi:PAS domain S-box-containing protein
MVVNPGQDSQAVALLQNLLNNAPVGFALFDTNLRYLLVSKHLAELNGVPAAAHIGRRVDEVVPSLTDQARRAFDEVIRTGKAVSNLEFSGETAASPGEVRYWSENWFPLFAPEGDLLGVGAVVNEITGRKRMENALAESERLYRAIGESIDYGVWVCAPDGRNTYASESFLKLLGITQEQCSNFGWGELLHPEDRERTIAAWQECVRAGGFWDREHRFRLPDGSYRHILARGVPVRNGKGELICWAGINLDITGLRRAEERLRQAQKLESIGLLAGGIAHDFNNLLVGVIGNASLAQAMLPPGHPAALVMQDVVKTGERAASLTRQMLAYAGKAPFVIEPVDLSTLIADFRILVQPSIPGKVNLTYDLAMGLPPVEADVSQVQQVFMNLVINAAEATGASGGVISVRTGLARLDPESLDQPLAGAEMRPGDYVILEVLDSGCGMDEATRARIFDPFFSTKFAGRGLGLAAVSGILRAHRAAVEVTSAPGVGSRFTVYFPISTASVAARRDSVAAAAGRGSGTVLVVDDEPAVRETACRVIEQFGYTAVGAGSASAAMDLLRENAAPFAAIILDHSMPGMSGEEALPELRKLRPGVPVIVSSGYAESETMDQFAGHRVSGFLQKPYTSSALLEALRAATER